MVLAPAGLWDSQPATHSLGMLCPELVPEGCRPWTLLKEAIATLGTVPRDTVPLIHYGLEVYINDSSIWGRTVLCCRGFSLHCRVLIILFPTC